MSDIFFTINVHSPDQGEVEFTCTGDNTELYIHHPNFKDVDHVFHRYDPEDRRLGAFMFRQILGEEEFERIRQYIYETGTYPITYRPEPTDSDMEQFLHFSSQDIDSWDGNNEN